MVDSCSDQEYEELANRIHELQTQLQDKEQELTDIETAPPEIPDPDPAPVIAPRPPDRSVGNGTKQEPGTTTIIEPTAVSSPNLPMKSPLGHVKAFLPNSQHTSVCLYLVWYKSVLYDAVIINSASVTQYFLCWMCFFFKKPNNIV